MTQKKKSYIIALCMILTVAALMVIDRLWFS